MKRKAYWRRWGVRQAIKRRNRALVEKHFPLDAQYSLTRVTNYLDEVLAVSMYRYTRASRHVTVAAQDLTDSLGRLKLAKQASVAQRTTPGDLARLHGFAPLSPQAQEDNIALEEAW
jgi:hypothetical protein